MFVIDSIVDLTDNIKELVRYRFNRLYDNLLLIEFVIDNSHLVVLHSLSNLRRPISFIFYSFITYFFQSGYPQTMMNTGQPPPQMISTISSQQQHMGQAMNTSHMVGAASMGQQTHVISSQHQQPSNASISQVQVVGNSVQQSYIQHQQVHYFILFIAMFCSDSNENLACYISVG